MEITTAPQVARRSTRVRVQIPVTVTSLDRLRPFAERCEVIIVSAQGCGFRSSRALQIETPVFLSDLPGNKTVTGRVASCIPLGSDSKYFLVGAALYTHGNVWGIPHPPADWNTASGAGAAAGQVSTSAAANIAPTASKASNKQTWPYNRFSAKGEAHPTKK
jgi:PilZ domain-containing protein